MVNIGHHMSYTFFGEHWLLDHFCIFISGLGCLDLLNQSKARSLHPAYFGWILEKHIVTKRRIALFDFHDMFPS